MAEGIGRGGRGARILEALKNVERRPGTSEISASQVTQVILIMLPNFNTFIWKVNRK